MVFLVKRIGYYGLDIPPTLQAAIKENIITEIIFNELYSLLVNMFAQNLKYGANI